jgi:rubrerythrin
MRNVNYNLVKMLLAKMDNAWRLENYYIKDAETDECPSLSVFREMLEDEKRHIELLREQISKRCDTKKFD